MNVMTSTTRVDERIANMEKKFSMIEEPGKTKTGKYNNVQENQNHGKAAATGFHGDSTEKEVEQLLRERRLQRLVRRLRMSRSMSSQTCHICFQTF